MKAKIVGDSSTDLNANLRKNFPIEIVPLKLSLGEEKFIDVKGFNVNEFIEKMVNYSGVPKSACPSPDDFIKAYDGSEEVFVVTLSKELSGTYNSAVLAKDLYLEEYKEKFIHVFNSKTASIGQTLIALKIKEFIDKKIESVEIIEKVNEYIEKQKTYFVAESLDNFIKNGRISKVKGLVANVFNIIPVMGATPEGNVELKAKGRGAKAYKKLVNIIISQSKKIKNTSDRILGIAHVNNLKRAEKIKTILEQKCNFKEIIIVETGGLSSIYCDNQGIIISF